MDYILNKQSALMVFITIDIYNIQKYALNGTSNPWQNITLYDLADAQNQPFKITYKDRKGL
jgi:hypothetical protein